MTGIKINNYMMLHLLWLIPLMVVFFVYAWRKRGKALQVFIDAGLLSSLTVSNSSARRKIKMVLILLAMFFMIIALTRPAWNIKPQTIHRRGRDVVFVLDVSRSMLADDLRPNRLERAKMSILDCVEKLQGDRVGLVVFAGKAVVKCPLTLDYGFFRMMLDDVSVESVSRGGTMIGDAIRTAMDSAFDDQEKQHKDLILITDGEDQDSFPIDAAKRAAEAGIRIIAIGLGDEHTGRRIPVIDENGRKTFLKYHGQEVWAKLDANTLRKIAEATPGGKYLNVATGTFDLGDIYMKLIASADKKELKSLTIDRYEEKFQIFVAIAFMLYFIEGFIGERKRA